MSYKVELSLEYLLVHPFVEIIERGIHHQSAKANGQGEEHLSNGRIPDMRIEQLIPLGLHKIGNTLPGTRQRQCSDQQNEHDDVGKECQEIGGLARTAYTLGQCDGYDDPCDQQAQHHLPTGHA